MELERAKTDAAQAQLADQRSSFDQQAKELNFNISRVATLEANAASDKAEVARLSAELEEVKGELKAVTIERDKLSGLYE